MARPKRAKTSVLEIAGNPEPDEKGGVAHSVVNRILDLLRTGMLRAGDRLPSERELIEILNISRPTLREALRALSILGVIDSRHGGGAYVTDLQARTLLAPLDFFMSLSEGNIADAFQSRRIVELEIVRMAACKATKDDIDVLKGMLVAHRKVLNDPVGFRILDSRFHARIWRISGNAVIERIAYGLYNMGLDLRRRATEDTKLIKRSLNEHERIVHAIAMRDPDGAAVALGLHLDHIESSTREALRDDTAKAAVISRAGRFKFRSGAQTTLKS